MNTLEPGRYSCWRVLTRRHYGSEATKVVSDPFTTEAAALEWAEKEKADITAFRGPTWSEPWVWTNRPYDLGGLEWPRAGRSRWPDDYMPALVVAWVAGSDAVAVITDEQVVR